MSTEIKFRDIKYSIPNLEGTGVTSQTTINVTANPYVPEDTAYMMGNNVTTSYANAASIALASVESVKHLESTVKTLVEAVINLTKRLDKYERTDDSLLKSQVKLFDLVG